MTGNLPRDYKLGLLIALLLAASMWFYVDHVYLGHQLAEAAAQNSPQGIFSDFYPRWLGARELLLHHRNPYSLEVTRDIQIGYYGRPLDPSRPGDPKDQMAFAYPLYVVFLIAPTIKFPFGSLRVAVHWLLVLLTASSVPLWLRALRWRVSPVLTAILVTLMVGTLPVVQGIKLEQLTLLVGGMIAGCALLLVSDYLVLAGILLAFATIKPQLVFLMATWLVCMGVRRLSPPAALSLGLRPDDDYPCCCSRLRTAWMDGALCKCDGRLTVNTPEGQSRFWLFLRPRVGVSFYRRSCCYC